MDKLEYIPGDLVIYASLIKEPVAEICEVHEASYTIKFMHGNFEATSKEIKPITLTPEILEKNGWEFMGHQVDFGGFLFDIYSKRDILPYLYYYYKTKDFSVSICGEIALLDMKYIHELQHLLFGLGLNSEMEV